jgi:23S rRNA (cytidine1920-2'-O)/16S rRNA (cytidine1409-2'-O)-methyltransferase
MAKVRIDQLLVTLGLAPTRARAQALVMAGIVYVEGARIDKAGQTVADDADVDLRGGDHPYVSRGGVKLAGALDALGVDPAGKIVADFGASPGGFTDCVLQRGATRVYAIDVGRGQLHEKLRQDRRVISMERTNARELDASSLPEKIELVVIDASFIGLGKLLPAAIEVLRGSGEILAMVKPQFEVGPKGLKKGVVRDETLRAGAIASVEQQAIALGLEVRGRCDSVLAGPDGNVEAFLHLVPSVSRPRPAG